MDAEVLDLVAGPGGGGRSPNRPALPAPCRQLKHLAHTGKQCAVVDCRSGAEWPGRGALDSVDLHLNEEDGLAELGLGAGPRISGLGIRSFHGDVALARGGRDRCAGGPSAGRRGGSSLRRAYDVRVWECWDCFGFRLRVVACNLEAITEGKPDGSGQNQEGDESADCQKHNLSTI